MKRSLKSKKSLRKTNKRFSKRGGITKRKFRRIRGGVKRPLTASEIAREEREIAEAERERLEAVAQAARIQARIDARVAQENRK